MSNAHTHEHVMNATNALQLLPLNNIHFKATNNA